MDVFVVSAAGGTPIRLTWHPGPDTVVGWTRDGKIRSLSLGTRRLCGLRTALHRLARRRLSRAPSDVAGRGRLVLPGWSAVRVCPQHGVAESLEALPRAARPRPIQIARLSDLEVIEVPRENSNDSNPMWVDDTVYFLSDRSGPVTLFAFDVSKAPRCGSSSPNQGFDVKSASAGPGGHRLRAVRLASSLSTSKRSRAGRIEVEVATDTPAARPHFEKVAGQIQAAAVSPSGVRAAFEAHGEILTVPAEKGDIRNLTSSPAAAERDPAWSPDGQSVAYFSDESGEYQLHIRSQGGLGDVRKFDLGSPPSFFYSPIWSPDGKKIAFTDKRRNLWYVEIEKGAPVEGRLRSLRGHPARHRPLVVSRQPLSRLHHAAREPHAERLRLLSRDEEEHPAHRRHERRAVSGVRSQRRAPLLHRLDRLRALRRLARSLELRAAGAAQSVRRRAEERPSLPRSLPRATRKCRSRSRRERAKRRPLRPRSSPSTSTASTSESSPFPCPRRTTPECRRARSGELYLLEQALIPPADEFPPKLAVHRFRLEDRKTEKVVEGVTAFDLSENGEKIPLQARGQVDALGYRGRRPSRASSRSKRWRSTSIRKPSGGRCIERPGGFSATSFTTPPFTASTSRPLPRKYEGFLERVSSRADLNFLFEEMLGELTLGHVFVAGGDLGDTPR